MYKGNLVCLRLLEPGDYELTYKWRNDDMYQKYIFASFNFNSKELEKNWVVHYSTHDRTDVYLAICLVENDDMIGWYSINNIDHRNRNCHCGGIVIGDKRYRDGIAYQEAGKFAFDFVINELNMNRVTGSCFFEHIMSRAQMEAKFWKLEDVERQALYKNGNYHDICHHAILKNHLQNGDYEENLIIRRAAKRIKELRQELKTTKNI
ncbi:MAG: GNAT family N-acetyltransferase [Bacteroidaceae bacterium]|nr:GNAT family N-acetyltransferase [Bacteroidaceae bacterium]